MRLIDKILALFLLIFLALVSAVALSVRESAVVSRMALQLEQFVGETLRLALYCTVSLLVLSVLAGLTLIWAWISKRRTENLRQRDGSYPLQRVRIGQATVIIDPNKTLAPALVVSPTGIVEVFSADQEAHLRHAIERSKVAQMQALAPGDAAIDGRNGFMYRPGAVFNNAVGKHLAGAYERQPLLPKPQATPQPPAAPVSQPRLALRQVLERAAPHGWLAGQDDAGEFAVFNPLSSIHAGIVGSTGTGKTTSAGYMLAAQALRTGYHVVIIDPKNGADWSAWRNHAEWHASDPELFERQVAALWREHERRQQLLLERGAADVAEIGAAHTLVIVEEYGDLISQLRRTDRSRADATDNTLDRLMRLSRRTGIHLLMIDQYPEEWSNQVLAGCRYLIVFRLGPNQGAKVGEYRADRLPDAGRFSVRGREYNAWFAAPHLDKMLAITPASAAPRVIDGEAHLVSDSVSRSVSESVSPEVDPPPADGGNTANKWDDFILSYMERHAELWQTPPKGIRELARAMSRHETGTDSAEDSFVGIASKTVKRFRDAATLPSGAKFGTDISHTETTQ